jgi:hypothetical protein
MKRGDIVTGALYSDGTESRKVIAIFPRMRRHEGSQGRIIYRVVSGPRPHHEHEILLSTFLKFAKFRCNLAEKPKFMEFE